ncbi:MAG: CotH kinase family protein, partial [Bacteroidota bacterium]
MNTRSIKICLSIAYCFMMTQVFSQVQLGDSTYNYFIGKSEPPADWNSISFDDNSWESGYSVIGYGNHNDTTKIDTCTSVYIRLPFEIESLDNITKFNLMADYSDGYIAYINGIEILRINMGEPHTVVAHNELATRSRDMLSSRYQCNPLMGYFIDEDMLQTCLVEGENILAIQVHNDSVADSNIGFNFGLYNISTTQYSPYKYSFKAINQISVDSTTLPIIKIVTDEKGIYDCKKKTTAFMQIIDIPNQKYNYYNDSIYNYKGLIGIEPRGQSSLQWPKKNYSIEFRDERGEDSSVAVLGMPKESDWVLHGPFADRSQIRNALAYTLSNQ